MGLTALLTFGSLMATVGPRWHMHRAWGRHGYYDHQPGQPLNSCANGRAEAPAGPSADEKF